MKRMVLLLLPPDHLVDDAGVGLDEFDDLGADVFVGVCRHRDAVVAVADHLHCYINSLKQIVFVDAGEDEAAFIESLRSFGGCTDAYRWERVPYACEE